MLFYPLPPCCGACRLRCRRFIQQLRFKNVTLFSPLRLQHAGVAGRYLDRRYLDPLVVSNRHRNASRWHVSSSTESQPEPWPRSP
eukprot:scaffold23820_cov54-Phaeocystis_antarctica.AAC.4